MDGLRFMNLRVGNMITALNTTTENLDASLECPIDDLFDEFARLREALKKDYGDEYSKLTLKDFFEIVEALMMNSLNEEES